MTKKLIKKEKSKNTKKISKSSIKKKSTKQSTAKTTTKLAKPEIEGLEEGEQPLFYYGPPPAIKGLNAPLNFDRSFHPMDLLSHMREGSSRSEICAAWGIQYSTFNLWIEKYPELAEAYAVGKPAYDAYYKRALRHSAFGQIKGVREYSLFFMLKNTAGYTDTGGDHEYSDGMGADLEFIDDDDLV